MKKVCFFGIYNPQYTRNRVLTLGFERLGYEIAHCRVDPKKEKGFSKYWKLYKEYKKIQSEKFDLVIVAFPGHSVVWLARLLFGKNFVFDAFVSLHNAKADRELYKGIKNVFRLKDFFLDWMAAVLSPKILLDTNQHIEYFAKTYHISEKKFLRVLIGADDTQFASNGLKNNSEKFVVHYHGGFIRIQGIEYIIEAAALLKNEQITFQLVGSGELVPEMREIVSNLDLQETVLIVSGNGKVPIKEIVEYAQVADVCVGIFADSPKTKRVIPTKVFEYIALGKATISADTPVMREFFTDRLDVYLVPVRSPQALADAILELKRSKELRDKIAEKSHQLFKDQAKPEKIAFDLLMNLKIL